MWVWGQNHAGQLGQNDKTERSSPIQIPGTEWTNMVGIGPGEFMAIQDDQTP